MKLKHFLCAVIATTVLVTSAIGSAFAENSMKDVGAQTQTEAVPTAAEYVVTEDTVMALGLENPCFVSKDGSVEIEEGVLIDLVLPKELNEEELTSVAARSFAGCPYIRSVVVPETILEIGEGAFADCEFLETIFVIGHNADDLTLGENWNGNAEVVYVAEAVPTAADGLDTESKQIPVKDNAEETPASAAETESKDAQLGDDSANSVPSNVVDETVGEESVEMSAESNESSAAPVKGSVTTEA